MATYESRRYNTPVTDVTKIADGSVNNTEFETLDGVTSDIQTQLNAKLSLSGGALTGALSTNSNISLGDSDHIYVGDGQDIDIVSDGSAGYIRANDLRLTSSTGENYITTAINGATKLFYDNVLKAETTGSGLTVSGAMAATTVTGDGSALTALNGSNIASGTVADARISTLTSSKLTGALPAIDGSALTGISVVPSATSDIGSILEFQLFSTNSSFTATTLGHGTTVTPNTYTNGTMQLMLSSGVRGSLTANVSNVGRPEANFAKGAFVTGSGTLSGTRTTLSGTWRVIAPLYADSGTVSGSNGYTYRYSVPGLMQRIS
jgi:hypothetical protein